MLNGPIGSHRMCVGRGRSEVEMPLRTRGGKLTKLGRFERDVLASSLPGGEREKYAIANKVGLMRGSKATAKGKRVSRVSRRK